MVFMYWACEIRSSRCNMLLCHGGNGVTIMTFCPHKGILEEQILTTEASIFITSFPFKKRSAYFSILLIYSFGLNIFFFVGNMSDKYETNKHVPTTQGEEEYKGTEMELGYKVPVGI